MFSKKTPAFQNFLLKRMRREQMVIRFSHDTLDSTVFALFYTDKQQYTVNWCVLVHDTFGSFTSLLKVQVCRWVRRVH